MIKRMLLLLFLALVMCVPALYSQDFDISEFSDPHKYGWIDEETRLAARDSLFLNTVLIDDYNEQMQSPILNAVKTAIAPGWGHFSVGSYTKGQVFLASQLVLLGTSIYYREQAMIDYRKYENATHIDDINGYYDSAITPYRQSNLIQPVVRPVFRCLGLYNLRCSVRNK